jgi:hypothetical protein
MDDMVKIRFARALIHKEKAEDLPKFYADFYDLVTRRCGELISQPGGPPKTEWPVIAASAEFFHRLDERVKALETAGLAAAAGLPTATTAGPTVHIDVAEKIDLRTREGRALKMQAVGAV